MNSTLQVAQPGESRPEVNQIGIPAMAWILVLLIACYAPILIRLVDNWIIDEDMGHGFFVPAIAGYIAWQKRDQLAAANLKSNPFGLLILGVAALQSIIGVLGAELFLSRTAFLLSVLGCVVYLGGIAAVRILVLPLFLLIFMVPIPAIIYNQITFPLQILASRVAEAVLSIAGIPVLRDGNVLELPSQKLSVVEACSGIRSLLSLTFLSLVYGFFFDSKPWMKWALLVSIVPIAIAANAGRVTITGLLSEVNPEYAQGVYHSMSGWVVFVIALVLLVTVHQLINRIHARFIKEK
jgi:exosortase